MQGGFGTQIHQNVTDKEWESWNAYIDEDEKGPVERILFETVFDEGGEPFEGLPHIDMACRNVNGEGKAVQHGAVTVTNKFTE